MNHPHIVLRTLGCLALCALLTGCSTGLAPRLLTGDRAAFEGVLTCQEGNRLAGVNKATRRYEIYEATANAMKWLANNVVVGRTVNLWLDGDRRANRIRVVSHDKWTPIPHDKQCNRLPYAAAALPLHGTTLPPALRGIPPGDVAGWLLQRLIECFLEGRDR